MSLDAVRARTAARKAAGENQTYPQHANKPKAIAARSLPVVVPCAHAGPDAGPAGWHVCDHPNPADDPLIPSGDVVCGTGCNGKCTTRCPGYVAAEMSNFQEAEGPREPGVLDNSAHGLVIDHGAGGIGDGLLGLAAVARLAAENPDKSVEYRVSDSARPFVALFDGRTTLGKHAKAHSESPVPGARQLNAGYQEENRERYQRPRWERYAANAGASGVLIPPLREPAKVKAAGADLAGCVALLPFSTDRAREWSLHHWLTLEGLLLAAGYRTAVLHSEAKPLERFQGAKVAGRGAERVAGVLANACCAVGTDSGLAHLAGILGAPTVVLGGSTPVARIFGCYPRVTCIQGGLSCSGCCGGTGVAVSGLEDRCRASCANLQSIAPERVVSEVDRVWLKETLTCDSGGYRTLLTADRLAALRNFALATNHLPGDAAELGCFRGGSAKLLRHYAKGVLHLFDTFAGLPADDTAEGGHHKAGEFAAELEEVKDFVGEEGVEYHVGAFPTGGEPDALYRLVHLDADLYESTAAALAYFAPRMVKGGVILLDDFGWWACPGVGRACHEAGYRPERSAEYQGVIRF